MIWVVLAQCYSTFAWFFKGWLGWPSTHWELQTSILETLNINCAALGCLGRSTGSQWLPWLAVYGTNIPYIYIVFAWFFRGWLGWPEFKDLSPVRVEWLRFGPTSNMVTNCQVTSKTITALCTRLSRTGRKSGLQITLRSLVAPGVPVDYTRIRLTYQPLKRFIGSFYI